VADDEAVGSGSRDARRRARAHWAGRVHRDGTHPPVDTSHMTPDERVAAVWTATVTAWTLAGHELPRVPRHLLPGRVLRRG
jgi:hypothetical protein